MTTELDLEAQPKNNDELLDRTYEFLKTLAVQNDIATLCDIYMVDTEVLAALFEDIQYNRRWKKGGGE